MRRETRESQRDGGSNRASSEVKKRVQLKDKGEEWRVKRSGEAD